MSAIGYRGNLYSGLTTESKFLKYDNSKSNLDSTNTQDAIDELKNKVDDKASSTHSHKVAEISDLTATATELNYMDGVTSNVQAQINNLKTSDTKDNTTTFTSGDSTSPTGWTNVNALTSGEKHSSIFNKVSTMFKNIRYLYKMLGNADISALSTNGTVTDALVGLNTNKFDKSGGKITGSLSIGDFLKLWSDNEGGNIDIIPPTSIGGRWCLDAYGSNGSIRLFHYKTDGSGEIDYYYSFKPDGTFNGKIPWDNVQNKPSTYPPSSHSHEYLPLSGGKLTGAVNISELAYLSADSEGGLLQLKSANKESTVEFDNNNNAPRLVRYAFTKNGTTYPEQIVTLCDLSGNFKAAGDVKTSSGTSLDGLKTSKADVETYVSNWHANIAYDTDNQITAHGIMNKKSGGLCDIHLQIGIQTMTNRSSSVFKGISVAALCSMFGVNSIGWHSNRTKVSTPFADIAGIGTYTGFTGLVANINNDGIELARWYTGDGVIGSWETDRAIWNPGTIYSIDIYGASYT